jgi:hypothetical protein
MEGLADIIRDDVIGLWIQARWVKCLHWYCKCYNNDMGTPAATRSQVA